MRLPKPSSAVGADDRVQRHARLARARADLADELALQRLLVELALAGDDGPRRAHALVEVERVEHERRAGLERRAVLRPQPAARARRRAPVIGTPRGSFGSVCASSSSRCFEPLDHRRVGALLRPEDLRRVLERRAHVAQHDDLRAADAAGGLDRLDRARAAVGRRRAADRDQDHRRARPARRPRSARRCRRWRRSTRPSRPRTSAEPDSPSPSRRSPSRRPRPGRSRC